MLGIIERLDLMSSLMLRILESLLNCHFFILVSGFFICCWSIESSLLGSSLLVELLLVSWNMSGL